MKKYSGAVFALLIALSACSSSDTTSSSSEVLLSKNAALPATTVARSATPTASGGSCAATGPCKVGQTGPAGGVVFLVASAPQPWGQFMEVKPGLFGTMVPDWCPPSEYLEGAIGDGLKQLNNVIKSCNAQPNAKNAELSAFIVDAYSQKGFSDWFIPSKDELAALAKSKVFAIPTNQDVSSYTYWQDPSIGFAGMWGFRSDTPQRAENAPRYPMSPLSDAGATEGDVKIRNGKYYIARAFGPANPPRP